MRTVKTLVRLGGCPGWSESSLGAYASLLVLSWGGSYVLKVWWDGLCTEGGEEQPSPIKPAWFAIPLPRGFELHYRWISTGMYELMTVTFSGFAVVSQSISGSHGRDLHWLSSISRQAGPPPCNTRSAKCYAPVICNYVSYGPEE